MIDNSSIQHLKTLAEHQEFLHYALMTAREQVQILSPYICISAIKSENISTLVQQAVTRGVQVHIYIDSRSNSYADGTMADRAVDAVAELIQAGAQVAVVNGLHDKLIARDNDVLAHGEFTWLSAVRIRSGECSLKEPTQVFTGDAAAAKVLQGLARIEETGYGFASIQETDDGLEITKTGKLFGLFSILIIPLLFGNDLRNILAGLACTAIMLTIGAIYYGVKAVQSRNPAPV